MRTVTANELGAPPTVRDDLPAPTAARARCSFRAYA